jgi:hypothetical protein
VERAVAQCKAALRDASPPAGAPVLELRRDGGTWHYSLGLDTETLLRLAPLLEGVPEIAVPLRAALAASTPPNTVAELQEIITKRPIPSFIVTPGIETIGGRKLRPRTTKRPGAARGGPVEGPPWPSRSGPRAPEW